MFSIKNLKVTTQGALTLSLCTVLSYITLFKMPYGGSVTLGHTVPLLLFSFKNGFRAGTFTGLIYGVFRILISFNVPPAKSFFVFVLVILLDYLVPYALVGMAPFYTKMIKDKKISMLAGALISGALRLLCSVISGVFLWSEYAAENVDLWSYSLLYNSSYMIPEIIITAVICYSLVSFLLPSKQL